MLIPPVVLRNYFKVNPSGTVHVGAHRAEERAQYLAANFGPVLWVEAQESLIQDLELLTAGSNDAVVHACVWGESNVDLTFHVASNSQSSSLFEFSLHRDFYPEVETIQSVTVTTTTLDDVLKEREGYDFLNLDIQGAELQALAGAGESLQSFSWIYLEVNRAQLYSDIPLIAEIDEHLSAAGFTRVATIWTHADWGDALYMKKQILARLKFRLSLLGKLTPHLVRLFFWRRRTGRQIRVALQRTIQWVRGNQ